MSQEKLLTGDAPSQSGVGIAPLWQLRIREERRLKANADLIPLAMKEGLIS